MKIRAGFVSNSSSSSFVLDKRQVTEQQLEAIRDHVAYAKEHFHGFDDNNSWDTWSLDERTDTLLGFTSMDNFDMWTFLELIGVPDEALLVR